MQTTPIRKDTNAWKMQVWVWFGIAVSLCACGLAWLPGQDLDRAFMVPMWGLVVWGGFALAMALTAWGLWRMDVNPTYKAFLGVSWLFLISSVFTLAKTLRDAHEALVAEHGAL